MKHQLICLALAASVCACSNPTASTVEPTASPIAATSASPGPNAVSSVISSMDDLAGHTFTYHGYDENVVKLEVRVEKVNESEFQIFYKQHAPAGVSETSEFVDSDGIVLRNGPNTDGDFKGEPNRFWLGPVNREKGKQVQLAGFPMPMTVLGQAAWKGTLTWVLQYQILGEDAWAQFDANNGVLVGQTGTGYLAETSLTMNLPNL